ncbi:MAG TPA: 6-carboxytetrahydropterin synthase [Nevskiaceae bacterium]|nr:6-carboxytetrahydropterin synthase [Nevskiaceae bacterium]
MSILFVDQLTVIDCAVLDARRGLVGESWIVDLELEGALDEQSMVLDFGEVKKRLKRAIDHSVDHCLLAPRRSPRLRIESQAGLRVLHFEAETGTYRHASPDCAVALIDAEAVAPDAVIGYLQPRLQTELPASVRELRLHLRPESIDGPSYHYVHGLKKHRGACQRIAHGHRSRLEIRLDGHRQPEAEQQQAAAWRDVYLASRDDRLGESGGQVHLGYDAPEGRYELSLPASRLDWLDGDSTVECIAEELHRRWRPQLAAGRLEIRAYEGVMKGAIARDDAR